ncbi:MAG: Protein-glutamate O-methyltransferase, partial [Myxococcaceae bacterium]|nr:Protein-glutamate O-methyltransferase [Myxococcaceae bacterium]
MTREADVGEVERFRAALARRFGLAFEDSRAVALAEVLRRRAEAASGGIESFLARLESNAPWDEELRGLVGEITVPETYFFRNEDQFRALRAVLLLDGAGALPKPRSVRLLSLGCASGEEPYSLAILMRAPADAGWNVSIRAFDLNPKVLAKAARARYSTWALRGTSTELRDRWFRADGNEFVLDERVRAMVTFEERNLTEHDPRFWQNERADVIFCRNVLMYMTPDAARAVVARIAATLVPGGFLFLGHAETLRGLSQDFHLRHTHDTFYYQRRELSDGPREEVTAPAFHPVAPRVDVPPQASWAESWIETVGRASDRIATLSASTPSSTLRVTSGAEIARVFELIGQERFAEAQVIVGNVAVEDARDPDVLLLRAVLLTHGGDLLEAERVSSELLAIDEMHAGAHYVLALCRESRGDAAGAQQQDRLALYLDPRFAMPRLHLGLLARRAGDAEGARRELAQALVLL